MTKLKRPGQAGFRTSAVYQKAQPGAVTLLYMKQKTSFFVAALCLVAFVGGNMVGQHGWYAFWKSVFGASDDSLILYAGLTTPIDKVPDYTKWSTYGGSLERNTYRQVPQDLLVPLPKYDPANVASMYYSVGYMGSYKTGGDGDGSHPGVDIRVPEGTPIRSVGAGIVTRVSDDGVGFGKLIVIKHPNVPDPERTGKTVTIYSAYAHLSAQYVEEGDIVGKAQAIGLSGMTGDATGPHLHFQIDGADAPWHPYWPFTSQEARSAGYPSTFQAVNNGVGKENGYANTLSPMLLVQGAPLPSKAIVASVAQPPAPRVTRKTLAQRAAERRLKATAQQEKSPVVALKTVAQLDVQQPPAPVPVAASSSSTSSRNTSADAVASIDITHDGMFSGREWETVRITLRGSDGQTVQPQSLDRDLVLRTAFGEAEFRPAALSILDFKDGVATVNMLPRGRRTLILQVQPGNFLSGPMKFSE